MRHDGLELHNVAETRAVPDRDGVLLQRVPEDVRRDLNEGAQDRMCHPSGVEIRFVPEGTVEVTLSTRPQRGVTHGTVEVFWGPFQGRRGLDDHETFEVGPEPTTIEVEFPDRLGDIADEHVADLPFDPGVCRLRLPGEHRGGHVFYHGADGDYRAPDAAELPDRRYLAYGTSITEGEAPTAEHLNYVSQTATLLGADLLNLGSCGTAYADAAMAEHVAGRDDWDVATLALSVNMVGTFSVAEFRERAEYMVNTVAAENPEKPVAAVTIYTNARDVCEGVDEDGECAAFREALREVVAESPHDNLHLIEGREVLDTLVGLTPDLVHPGDDAMIRMGENLADELDALLEGGR